MTDPDPDQIILSIFLQIFLIALNAVFACAEIAVISINENKLEYLSGEGNKRAKRLLYLTKEPAKFLATIQVGITLAGFLGSAFAADNFSDILVSLFVSLGCSISPAVLDTVSVIIITLVLSYFTLIFGELVPKRIAMRKAEAIGLAMSGPIYAISKIFSPVVWFLTVSVNCVLRLIRIDPEENGEEVTEEEIRMMVDAGSENGAIDIEEKEFIHNIFEFDDITADEVMTHRTEISALWLSETDEKWEKTVIEGHHTIYPVFDASPDAVVGILNVKDYFRLSDRSRESVLKNAVKPAQFVPETVRADVLFRNMKKSRNHFALVLDEYGGVCGIVTINDLLEQLVGDIDDEAVISEECDFIEPVDKNTWSIGGGAHLDEVAKKLGVSLPEDEYETFSGMVFGILGSIPADGSDLEIEKFGLIIKVTKIKNHRVYRALVCLDGGASEK